MKKLFCLLIISIVSLQSVLSQVHSQVDERFELTSIMFTLAGVPEFCECDIPAYFDDILHYLTPYELTEPINYIRELNQHHGIGYNAVSTTAEMLEIKNGKIRLQLQYDISKISDYSSSWNEELFTEYIKQINKFYKQSNFHKFYTDHRDLYDIAEKRMDILLTSTFTEWFESFFGQSFDADDINIYISMNNGRNNYSMNNGILIGMYSDENGLPAPDISSTLFPLIHELCHHYTNPLFREWWKMMEESANTMYPYIRNKMLENAYGSAKTTFLEWLNNLFCLMYYNDTGNKWQKKETGSLVERGFIWMERSIEFMDNFYNHRNLYPHIENFMPQIIAFLDFTADNYDRVIWEYENRQPYITNVFPAIDSDITGFDEIIVTFSEQMHGAYGFYGSGSDDKDIKCLYLDSVEWSDDKMQVILKLNTEEAEHNCLYSIQLVPIGFISERYFPLDEKCKIITFNTIHK